MTTARDLTVYLMSIQRLPVTMHAEALLADRYFALARVAALRYDEDAAQDLRGKAERLYGRLEEI